MLERIRISIARASEIRNLERLVAASPRAKACNIHQLGHDRAVWCIPVPGQADRYMSASAGHIGSEMFAVHVDADAFYLAWLRSDEQCVLRSQMPRDYKYAYAVDGFAQGSSNPVPLADVGAWNDERGRSHIGFTNGITRSFWLISNGAPSFPVQVYGRESAELLHRTAGTNQGPICYADLFAPAEPRNAPNRSPSRAPRP
ncbi:hypothetical protein DXO206_023120 (plasmid) [Xanthomonas oryzae pv. oryzae]|uniref:plasmid fertility inhibition factor family protein n=1 Tax=Xanthomonas TaxID=338 RepID=UPI000949DD8C|nr:hypothetical protein EBA18_24850 [Xanthomonas oryzae pv. oryzae]WDN17625.1 hypothetical protein LL920_23615 [Xanthomonas oryzae]QEJ71046.1 hypothetical protein BXO1_025095 [Xanthomonas oryzae pv. oryzae]RBB63091.1 hypothetical protein BRN54_21670 [Xanthomonas oryzae pv. oryzae]RBG62353.1 hypothetical protein BRM42_00295 [Xanthomonas oryzae pv. oryzae]